MKVTSRNAPASHAVKVVVENDIESTEDVIRRMKQKEQKELALIYGGKLPTTLGDGE